jgi:hypothetical protein
MPAPKEGEPTTRQPSRHVTQKEVTDDHADDDAVSTSTPSFHRVERASTSEVVHRTDCAKSELPSDALAQRELFGEIPPKFHERERGFHHEILSGIFRSLHEIQLLVTVL